MRAQIISIYKSSKTGTKKDGAGYGMVKCLDDVNDSFFNLFCEEVLVQKIQKLGIARNQEVVLTIDILIGYNKTYVQLVDVDLA